MRTAVAALILATCWPGEGARALSDPPEQLVRHWHFKVSLDGKPIGVHDFAVTTLAAHASVEAHARFAMSVMGIPIYRYEHWDNESWQGGCLTLMQARTDNNHRHLSVNGARTASGFTVRSEQGDNTLPGCVGSFAYWDLKLIDRTQLLNAQTGRYEPVTVQQLGENTAPILGRAAGETHIRLRGESFVIDLWYRSTGQWIALETQTQSGHLLRYELDE